jgi:dipeptidase D
VTPRPPAGLEPSLLWERFFELTEIPRPPKAERPAREHVLAWAAERRFEPQVDGAGNVVVAVRASAGREGSAPVALQSHLDMVCERDPESPYDPREGRINVVVEDDWVAADGTTLGADNGIGVAAAMAIAEDELEHGPLELLFTVSEEEGLDGAKALEPSLLASERLVNLDGTSDDAITVGCAGSIHSYVRRSFDVEVPLRRGLEVRVSGARGGHSGEDIASGRANANKVLGRILARAYWRPGSSPPFRLVLLEGGVSRNAIPREARAVVAANDPDEFRTVALAEFDTLQKEFATSDPDLAVDLEWSRLRYAVDDSSTGSLVHLISELPTGVIAMSPDRPDVVETSTSLTVVQTDEDRQLVTFGSMTRSASPTALDEVASQIEEIAKKADADVELVRSYPPWAPRLDSKLLGAATRTYRRLFGAQPVLTVVHGGLECAVLGEKLPGAEMISIGPEIVGPHAPGEKVRISSTQRFYRLLGGLLDELSR